MSGQTLLAELNTLAQETKRKHPEIRSAAEKSLQDLKSLPATSEQQLAADLSRRPAFIDPFVLACNTKNPKYAGGAAVCLQRLVIIRALPKSRLKDVLEAFHSCTSLTLDIQLKVLQALPALAQSYADDLKGDQLATALQVCAALQTVKAATVSGVAAATLQQLVVSVFDKVATEDGRPQDGPVVTEVPGEEGPIPLREAAHDAYRVFLDVCLATEGRRTKFVKLSSIPQAAGLELIWTCLHTHASLFARHAELTTVLRKIVMPFLIRVISERQSFALTLRAIRVASIVIRDHLEDTPGECEVVLGLLTHMLEPEAAALWKRAMCMEVFRMIYTEPGIAMQLYLQYDANEGKKTIVKDNIAMFVRLSTERPSILGLGGQSSVPTGPSTQKEINAEQAVLEATGGVAGVIGAALGVGEANVPGVSSQWSVPKAPCLDQLDKSEPPSLPETYMYSLVLECLNGLSENLAKMVLPLTVQHENSKSRRSKQQGGSDESASDAQPDTPTKSAPSGTRKTRSQSYRLRAVPLNPLTSEQGSAAGHVKAIAELVEECWPALLATYSTFLYAALDNDYYRTLIRSYQRFLQVAGLLRLSTARDAFLTTLGKAAVPANVVGASFSGTLSPVSESAGGVYSNGKSLLSVDSLASQLSASDKSRRPSSDPTKPLLTTRNLLCLRALLNVAIAIGPTLESSFAIVFETLQQAGVVLNSMRQTHRDSSGLGSEVSAVEAAALRLFESTADYPNDAFLHVLQSLCKLFDGKSTDALSSAQAPSPISSPRMSFSGRRMSTLSGLGNESALQTSQDYIFVLTRLGEVADLNVARFTIYDAEESGWNVLVSRLVDLSIRATIPNEARQLAADILSRCSVAIADTSVVDGSDDVAAPQKMVLSSLQMLVQKLYNKSDELTGVDIDIHGVVLAGVRSILEKCGEALAAGWDTILGIVSSTFEDVEETKASNNAVSADEDAWLRLSSRVIAPNLGRAAFGIMQLVCSDFLSSLPEACFSPLIEVLYRFVSQSADLNISLTAISLFWDVSDFLVKQGSVAELEQLSSRLPETRLTHSEIIARTKQSRAGQWMLLLYRLTDTISDERSEVRNGAFQTLLRIFTNHADDFSPASWQLLLDSLLLKSLREDVAKHQGAMGQAKDKELTGALDSMSKTLLVDSSTLIANNLVVITSAAAFGRLWNETIDLFRAYQQIPSAEINAAVWTACSTIFRSVSSADGVWKDGVDGIWALWSANIPLVQGVEGEQDAYVAYADCAAEMYRLMQLSASAAQITTMATHLVDCVRSSSAMAYGLDAVNTTPLQEKVLHLLKALRTDVESVPSALIDTAAGLVSLPILKLSGHKSRNKLTYIALSKGSIDWLVELVTAHIKNAEVFETTAIAVALEHIAIPILDKYKVPHKGKGPVMWQKATSAALTIVNSTLNQMNTMTVKREIANRVWAAIIVLARAVMDADLTGITPQPSLEEIYEDEVFDCESLARLRDMITPNVGESSISNAIRDDYARYLFSASIIHVPEIGDIPPTATSPLTDINSVRLGRVWDPRPSPREDIAYLCFRELISLTSKSMDGTEPRLNLAKTAAPWLVLRLALPLKAYIADQPLRGSMPTPLSQVGELLFCLEQMETLQCEPVVSDTKDGNADAAATTHLKWLVPLVVKAVGVAGDRRHGSRKILSALQRVLDTCTMGGLG